ncbi:PREDICTED: pentatricopeptide repeat-containing protein At1g80550, mitochondrial-like [Camelina sativa]|uniref:Pentatricopeptide repeat-containing protein At1g80550, mitochondrial-like n=1 Tax=Camelina sativa TaxID=90675 RepID=A0ABM0WLR7_CAMSA|nr:PREDICTED: pentatricopeptide repeat-containing protein At1g80550, mitochondrial-like [Camelina sativa]
MLLLRRFNRVRIASPCSVRLLSGIPISDEKLRCQEEDHSIYDQKTVCDALTCYSNDWQKALEFFNWVEKESGFRHTTETFNRMIDILGKYFEFETSWGLINRMVLNPESVPNHVTFRIVFKRYVTAHLVQEAIDAYDKLDGFNLRDETSFYNLVDALCEHKHVVEAEELCFGKNVMMIGNGFRVSNTKIHNLILRGWSKLGWWGKCKEYWEKMDSEGVAKDLFSYSIYMDIMCKSGKPWKAVKLFKEMKSRGIKLDVVAYNTVIRAIGVCQGVEFGIRVFREMRERGCEPNVATHNTIIKLLCEDGRLRDAYRMLDDMSKKGGCQPDSITYMCLFARLEKPSEILSLFGRMIRSGVRPKMDTYVMLMRKFERWGFLQPVLHVWKTMKESGDTPDSAAYNAVIDALIQKGMLDMAREYEEEMMERGLSPRRRPELVEKSLDETLVVDNR